MAVPHYAYLVLKMPGPRGIITIKGSFELSDLCDKEFHKMTQNFCMIANYGQPKDKITSATTGTMKQFEEHPAEPEAKKLRVQPSDPKEATIEDRGENGMDYFRPTDRRLRKDKNGFGWIVAGYGHRYG
jgi:hypothetical protein